MRPSPSRRTRLVRRPMASRIRRRVTLSPISLLASMTSSASRSMGGCFTSRILPPERYFRRSIQNMGGSAGFSLGRSVSCIRGQEGLAVRTRRQLPFRPRMWRRTSSRVGWWILSMRAPRMAPSVSFFTAARHSASMGMAHPSSLIISSKSWFRRSVCPWR